MMFSLQKVFRQSIKPNTTRNFAEECGSKTKGLVLGAYNCNNGKELRLTSAGEKFNESVCYKLSELLKGSGLGKGKAIAFEKVCEEFDEVAVAGLGPEENPFNTLENLEVKQENVRVAAGEGAKLLQQRGCNIIEVEDFSEPEAAAEGSTLSIWRPEENLKTSDKRIPTKVSPYKVCGSVKSEWDQGKLKAEAQNSARNLTESPPNLMTPGVFAQSAVELLCGSGVSVEAKEKGWIESMRMNSLISMARSSCEPCFFLEMCYNGTQSNIKPIVLTGKGITFASGGINLRIKEDNDGLVEPQKSEIAGGALVVSTIKAAAQMNLPINLQGLIPICECKIGGIGLKPGDVILGMNGKSIRIENTDTAGRTILADALAYSAAFKPCLVINIADLSSGLKSSLGEPCSGVFSTSEEVWEEIRRAGCRTGDRVWRFPLWGHFVKKVTDYVGVDVNNVAKGVGGETCLAAAFLSEFVPSVDFMHIDISGVERSGGTFSYLKRGLSTGRPTRTMAQFMYQIACPHSVQSTACQPTQFEEVKPSQNPKSLKQLKEEPETV